MPVRAARRILVEEPSARNFSLTGEIENRELFPMSHDFRLKVELGGSPSDELLFSAALLPTGPPVQADSARLT
jgi:hypothetical protein